MLHRIHNLGENTMPYKDPEQPKILRIQLSVKKHTELKILAAKFGTTMDKLVNQLITQKLEGE